MSERIARALAGAFVSATVLLSLVAAASGQAVLEGAGIPYGSEIGALVQAPKGWMFDNQSGVSQGLHCVMYPQGTTWRTAREVIYVTISKLRPGQTLEEFVGVDEADFKKKSAKVEVVTLPSITLVTGQEALVRGFTGDPYGNHECVAYARLEGSVASFILSCRTQAGYEKSIDPFREMVAGASLVKMENGAPAAHAVEISAAPRSSAEGIGKAERSLWTRGTYSQWARYKPGAFVTFKYTITSSQTSGEMLKTIRLKEVTPGFVRLTYQEAPAGATRSDYYDHQEQDFGEAEEEFEKESAVESLLNYHLADLVENVRGRTVDRATEEVELKGVKIMTARTKYEIETEGLKTVISVWWSEDVPGRLWRLVREDSGEVPSREEVVVTDFSAPAATSVEMERLRAGREPVAIEVPALDYLRARCRLPERLMDMGAGFLFKFVDGPSRVATPSSTDLLQTLDLAKVEFEADRQRIMTELGPQESPKLAPVLDIYEDVLDLELKIGGIVAEAEKKAGAGADKAQVIEALRDQTQGYRDQMRTLFGRLGPLMRTLNNVTVKFVKRPD